MSLDDDLRRMDDEEDMTFDLDSADDLDMGESDVLMDTVDELPLEVDFDDFNEDEDTVLPPPRMGDTENRVPGGLTGNGQIGMKLNVDVTVVLDVTGSMQDMIDSIKENVINFRTLVYERLNDKLKMKRPDRTLDRMRVRVVAFRDYNFDWEAALQPQHGPMLQSEFFDLNDDADRADLQTFVDQLEATGGEDDPESALEAIHFAVNSDWDMDSTSKHRHVIMVFTDAPALSLEDERNATNIHYPSDPDMPRSLSELYAEYAGKMDPKAQRLLLFAPKDQYPWKEMEQWNGSSLIPVESDGGLAELAMEKIISMLTGSL